MTQLWATLTRHHSPPRHQPSLVSLQHEPSGFLVALKAINVATGMCNRIASFAVVHTEEPL